MKALYPFKDSLFEATIVESFGRHYTAVLADGHSLHARPRGKRSDCAVGDKVQLRITSKNEAVIETIAPRRNVLMRAEEHRSKIFAANVDVLAYVVAPTPPVHDELLARACTAALAAGITVWFILNKADLTETFSALRQRMQHHAAANSCQFELSTRTGQGLEVLKKALKGKRVVFAGQSGMGKSTLLNALHPQAKQVMGELSDALSSGKHTTTATRMFQLAEETELIDSPGFQVFGIAHLSRTQLERGFPEFETYAPECKFYNCWHLDEPGCAIRKAVENGAINGIRYDVFKRLMREAAKRLS